ncbi:Mpv17/PMP22 family protein [Aspergillus foveolatus]|uniref:Mpv17/PMP22 family protein n=1 Tax=Aspergillus foveolatus TaxID=210207 RepID=UPI003CCCA061
MPSHGSVILQSTQLKTAANLTFAVCGVIQAEMGWHWHNFLEDAFPTSQPEPPNDYEKQTHRERKEYWLHIFLKLMLDQTAGSFAMNTVSIICTTAARVSSLNTLGKIWPAASLANFLWVPVDWRVLVSSCVGFAWNTFLSIWTLAKQEA